MLHARCWRPWQRLRLHSRPCLAVALAPVALMAAGGALAPAALMLQIDDVLLEEILLQLDGELCSILRRVADGGGPAVVGKAWSGKPLPVVAMEACQAALASRLVCRRWRALGDHALATTLIRLRLFKWQLRAAMYMNFLIESMPASAQQRLRFGRPDATVSQLASSPKEFMEAAYKNGYAPLVVTSASAAVELIQHLRSNNVDGPFVVFAAPKKLATWKRYLRSEFSGQVNTYASRADFVDVDWSVQEGAIVSYAATADWPKPHIGRALSYVIFDDARSYMWRPAFTRLFDEGGRILLKGNMFAVPHVLLDDFHAPCSLFELFNLVYYAFPREIENQENPVDLQVHVMEALDAFDFSPSVIDRLLRPQLEAATRHMMMS